MKRVMLSLTVTALVATGLFASPALGTSTHKAPRTLVVAMHDPGCHSFQLGARFTKSASVTGTVRVMNHDERALIVASRHGVRHIPVGQSLLVRRGNYVITMVRQASDDNYLRLTVH